MNYVWTCNNAQNSKIVESLGWKGYFYRSDFVWWFLDSFCSYAGEDCSLNDGGKVDHQKLVCRMFNALAIQSVGIGG